jgi:hypothetical protein
MGFPSNIIEDVERRRPDFERLLLSSGFTLSTNQPTNEVHSRHTRKSQINLVSFERGFGVVTYHVTLGSITVPVVMLNVSFKARR